MSSTTVPSAATSQLAVFGAASRSAAGGHRSSSWNVLALVAATGAAMVCARPLSDLDVWWHVEVGRYTLRGERFPHPDPWSFTLPDTHWHTTSWLSELVLAAVQQSTGWAGVVALRIFLTAGLLVLLWRLLVRSSQGWAGPAVFALIVLPLTSYVQERPQTASLLFLVWLAGTCARAMPAPGASRVLPHRWRFVAVTYFWATVHGLFVLAPGCLLLVALCLVVDRGRAALDVAARLAATAVLALAAASVTPMGPRLLLAPFTVGQAAKGEIAEWSPTNFSIFQTWGFGAVLLMLGVSWARSRVPAARSEVVFTVVLGTFGLLAFRNAGPVSILLAPLAVRAMQRTWRTESSLTVPRRTVRVLAAGCLLAVVATYAQQPVLPESRPSRIAAVLAAQPGQLRVLNDYNVSGYLISRAAPHVLLTVDGRADRYGQAFLARQQRAMEGAEHWEDFVAATRPDVAVVGRSAALGALLHAGEDWQVVLTDHEYQLLVRPGLVLAPSP